MNPSRTTNSRQRIAVLAVLSLLPAVAGAATVTFTPTDLADTTESEDLWLYEYRISAVTFGAGEGFTITFDRALFTKLQNPPPLVNADWDALPLQPDLALSSNGLYDALALRAAPSLANDFKVTAAWLGSGTPGVQPFVIYNSSFTPIATGQTAAVPEPATSLLILSSSGLALLRRPHRAER